MTPAPRPALTGGARNGWHKPPTKPQTREPHPMTYIQRRDNSTRQLETVDEFETRREARAMLTEYRMSDPSGSYYLSSRPCKEWASA